MVNEWLHTTIGEQATLQRGIDITKAQQKPGPIPVVSSGGISSYHDTAAVIGPGVILGRKGVVGSVYYIKSDYWPHDTTLWVKDFHGNNPSFVYYFFKSIVTLLSSMDVGSANPTLNRNHVHPIAVSWPPLPEQRAIAAILSALDDKIELNRQMNKTLEEMAQTVFKHWFIDFGPFRDGGMQDSKLGQIPISWRAGAIGDITEERNEKYGINLCNDDCAVLSAVSTGALVKSEDFFSKQVFSANLSKYKVVEQYHFAYNPARANIGSIGINTFTVKGLVSPVYVVFQPVENYHWFLDLYIKLDRTRQTIQTLCSGSVRQVIDFRTFSSIEMAIPPAAIICEFNNIYETLRNAIIHNNQEIESLSSLRDTLLPKLMSGELRVPVSDNAG